MLTLIHEDLMSFATTEVADRKTKRTYTKIQVMTSNKLQQYQSRINSRGPAVIKATAPTKPIKHAPPNRIESHSDTLISINREILRISAPISDASPTDSSEKNYDRIIDFQCPMSINISYQNRFQPLVDVRCHTHGEDRANIYVVAFPFNGMIRPLEENPCYRIYKGLIASSAKPFFFNNRKYRKVLYLIIEVNKNLYKENHPYHTDTVDLVLESFALFEDRDHPGVKKTNYEKCTLTFLQHGNYFAEWEYDTINDAIMMNVEPGKQLWPTYQFEQKAGSNGNNKPKDRNKLRNGQKPIVMEGDVLVTTNRHGIRKELPVKKTNNFGGQNFKRNNYKHDGGGKYQKGGRDIDSMMKDSGMFDDHDNRRDYKRGNNKKGKGKRR